MGILRIDQIFERGIVDRQIPLPQIYRWYIQESVRQMNSNIQSGYAQWICTSIPCMGPKEGKLVRGRCININLFKNDKNGNVKLIAYLGCSIYKGQSNSLQIENYFCIGIGGFLLFLQIKIFESEHHTEDLLNLFCFDSS